MLPLLPGWATAAICDRISRVNLHRTHSNPFFLLICTSTSFPSVLPSTRLSRTWRRTTPCPPSSNVSVHPRHHLSLGHALSWRWAHHLPVLLFSDISGEITVAGNSSSASSPSSSNGSSAGDKKSSATTVRLSSSGTLWTLLLAGMLLSVLTL
jgi:hypothetical protein